MAEYRLEASVDTEKVFLVKRSELDDKFEVSYHLPQVSRLEKIIKRKSTKKLRDYIVKVSSGATPLVTEEEKFYTSKADGIPFLRVQNLQTNGNLYLKDLKYINKETHEGYLKRSQVSEGDLLIKITGVGRMAIASVAPKNFVGNTNQHMVVIKTKNLETSKYLAKYLNLDFVEKLATRRATGGTRPALDFPALKSIPVIEGIDFQIIENAEILKQQKEAEAQRLLQSIDAYLLGELGITLPEKDHSLASRIFTTAFSEVVGGRMDPKLYDNTTRALKNAILNIDKNKFSIFKLNNFIIHSSAGDWGSDIDVPLEHHAEYLVIRATEFDNEFNLNLDNSRVKYRQIHYNKLNKMDVQEGDLLIEKSGGSIDQPVGRIAYLSQDILENNKVAYSNFIHKIRLNNSLVCPKFVFYFLKTIHNIKLTESMQSQTNGIRNLIMHSYLNQNIVIPIKKDGTPDLKKQSEIATTIEDIKLQAKQLQQEAAKVLETAKAQVEQMILG